MKLKRALLSVYDKEGLTEFARALAALGVELVSTGGTARHLEQAGLKVTRVDALTGSPELLAGRVKSLHPKIHAGILARRDREEDLAQLREQGIDLLDMVVVNLYPFAQTIADPKCSLERGLENIDIGGPAMLRAAAKNFPAVVPLCSPRRYDQVIAALERGEVSQQLRRELAREAFAHTAAYDAVVADWLEEDGDCLPARLSLRLERKTLLRYGENPHQKAALYLLPEGRQSLAATSPLQGKELSYNNLNDAAAAWQLANELKWPAAVAVKHAVPCGVGVGDTAAAAFVRAREADPVSIFGGIIAFNRPVDASAAALLTELFLEVVIAPDFTPGAREKLGKKKNLRLLAIPRPPAPGLVARTIPGGVLVQQSDEGCPGQWKTVTKRQPDVEQEDAWLAWLAAKHAKSNAIVVAKGGMTLGIGSGFTSRIGAAAMALEAAGGKAKGAVLASDGFIPFPDVVQAAAEAGIDTIIQPGGSKGDPAAIAAADERELAMVFTGIRHFKH